MRTAHAAAAALLFAVLTSACADSGDETDSRTPGETRAPATAPADNDDLLTPTLEFISLGGAALTGDVTIDADDGRTEVDVTIRNSMDGAVHKGHIHSGSCDAPGPVVAPLADVTISSDGEGDSENLLELEMASVMNGAHLVAFHEAGGNPGAPVLCVLIPAHVGVPDIRD